MSYHLACSEEVCSGIQNMDLFMGRKLEGSFMIHKDLLQAKENQFYS